MSDETPHITFDGIKIPIEFGYKEVIGVFKQKGLNILNLFVDDGVMMTIFINDTVMMEIWYHYISPHRESFEKAVEELTPTMMHSFKEAFWQAVINFTVPTMRPLAEAMAKKLKERLKSPEKFLEDSSGTS